MITGESLYFHLMSDNGEIVELGSNSTTESAEAVICPWFNIN